MYAPVHPPVVRRGLCYPVTIKASSACEINGIVQLSDTQAPIDGELRRAGEPHSGQLAWAHRMHDGAVVVLKEIVGETIYAERSRYFAMLATCDALRSEFLSGQPRMPLRTRAHLVAGHSGPVVSGRGRAAAIGVSVVVTFRQGRKRAFLLGRRRVDLALDGDIWQLAPSGMVEPSGTGDVVVETIRQELSEELSMTIPTSELAERLRPLGLAVDLLRLRPEVCVRFDTADGELDLSTVRLTKEEFSETKLVEFSAQGMAGIWSTHSPQDLTPAAAGAVALLEIGEDCDS